MSDSPISAQIFELATRVFPDGGTYLEAGAHDGIFFSNTYELEKLGSKWKGVLIEPSPIAFQLLLKNRPNNHLFNCALVGSSSLKKIWGTFLSGSPVSTVVPELRHQDIKPPKHKITAIWRAIIWKSLKIRRLPKLIEVPARTLASLCEELCIKSLEVMILDVEGYELSVLQGFGVIRPKILVVETRASQALDVATILCEMEYIQINCLSRFKRSNQESEIHYFQDFVWVQRSVAKKCL